MNQKTFANLMSIEKKKFNSNVQKYKRILEAEQAERVASKSASAGVGQVDSWSSELLDMESCSASSQASSSEEQAQHLRIVEGTYQSTAQLGNQLCSLSSIPQKKSKFVDFSQESVCSKSLTSSTALKNRRTEDGLENIPKTQFNEEVLNLLKKILQKQKQIDQRLARIEKNMIDRTEFMAQNKMVRECKIILEKVQQSVSLMTGEVQNDDMLAHCH